MSACVQDSTIVQHKFEQAVWEVSFVLQKSADDSAYGGARQKEYVARIRQALKNLIAVADEASEKDITLRWKNNPIFEWQSHLESLKWIPAYLANQCKANFAWFVVNVETSTGKGSATRPPGMGNLGVKKEDESILVADAVPVKLEDDGPEEKGKKPRTPVKPVMSIKKPLIITAIGAQTPSATPIFNAKLHVRNDPKCHQCRPRPRVPNGYDCFRKKVASHPASSCFRCILNHTKCVKDPEEVQFVPSDDEPPNKKRKGVTSPNSESEQDKRPKRNARPSTTRETAPSPPDSADDEQ